MILYDHTDTFQNGLNSGIQRVVQQLGRALAARSPDIFVPVIHSHGDFYRVPLGSKSERVLFHPIRTIVRRIGSGPLRTVRNWSNENRFIFDSKMRLWEWLDARKSPGPVIRPGPDSWYFTADAIWNWPQILRKLPALKDSGMRMASVVYDLTPLTHPFWYDDAVRRRFLPYAEALPSFDVTFCISEPTRANLLNFCRDRGYRTPKRAITIPMGYEITRNETGVPARRLPEVPFVLCVGTLEPRKNHRVLLEAFDGLWGRGVDLALVLVGRPGYASDEILRRIREHPLSGRMLLHLPDCSDEELEALYVGCAFTVLPSLFEGFGLPLVESLARGKPCVCSDIAIFRHIAGHFGVYFDPKDPRSIALAIENLYSRPDRLDTAVAAIRAGYAPPTWQASASAILDTLFHGEAGTPDA